MRVVLGQQEKVAQRRHARQRLQDDVHVVRVSDVVEADQPGHVVGTVDPARVDGHTVERVNRRLGELGVEHVLDIAQRRVHDLVAVGQAVCAAILQIHVHVVALLQRVRVRLRVRSTALEELAAHEARIHVEIMARHRACLLKVKVEDHPIDGIEVRAAEARLLPWSHALARLGRRWRAARLASGRTGVGCTRRADVGCTRRADVVAAFHSFSFSALGKLVHTRTRFQPKVLRGVGLHV